MTTLSPHSEIEVRLKVNLKAFM